MNTMNQLQHQVQTTLMEDSLLEDENIEVLDSNGVITLAGTVSTIAARERAEALARQISGVTSVINELDVV